MPPIHLLIKPASGSCNMRCDYCFYSDIIQNRETAVYGMMTVGTLETIVKKTLSNATGSCTFAFQGGEPTLIGLGFYKKLIELEEEYNKKGLSVNNAIQTNGTLINDEWAAFFAENNFLVGLSLDGVKDIQDKLRHDAAGSGTYNTVMRAARILEKNGAQFNILTVVTSLTAKSIGKIYGFFKRNNFHYQQYIPCLDPIGEERGRHSHSLTPELYLRFLKSLFDLWYNDVKRGEFIYIRYFENLAGILAGYPPESCGMLGRCANQLVIEADGGVYPCDFYVLDKYKIGDINTDSFEQIEQARKKIGFIETSFQVNEKCLSCKWKNLCRGGCRRDRDYGNVSLGLNYYCGAYEQFFEYAAERLMSLVR